MKKFEYDGFRHGTSERLRGKMQAPTREAALTHLEERGLAVHTLAELNERLTVQDLLSQHRPVGTKELAMMTRTAATLLDAGIPLLSTLETIGEASSNYRLRMVLGDVLDQCRCGTPLHEALGAHPNVFDTLYVGFVRAGETRGQLADSLVMLATQLEESEKLRQAIRQATLYPKIVATAVAALAAVVLVRSKGRRR